ncbi:copper resistance CopC/CopD family protein [Streptacidiphilus jiangxiensis]|uniref:Copper transport protein n=1 Tax=Streptacidiphilus jiangxiensis TaxID=235985 RepID=A0A1H7J294_STRJI|nr:copper resistance protein CopC [Streptacidiphilus jiangxiensis]SEK68883.1 copper transport protein [Streptacidiphilus jiangxiensis]
MRNRFARRTAALLALLVALLLGGAGVASAHAALLSTDPAQGSVVAVPPTAVTLRFSESVTLEPDALRVFDPSGKRVDTGTAGHAGGDASTAQVRIDGSAAAAQGTYTVAWRVISADTHPVAGAYTFSIGRTSPPATLTGVAGVGAGSGPTALGTLYGVSRAVQYGTVALLIGSVAAVLLCWPGGLRLRGVQRLMVAGWAGLLLATLAELLLRGTYEAGTGLGRVFDLSLLRQVLGEKLGELLAVRVLLLAGAGVFLALLAGHAAPAGTEAADESGALLVERRRRIGLGVTGALLAMAIALTWPLGDHASVGLQVPLAVTLDTVHILAMSLWLGGLATVLVGLRSADRAGGIDVRAVGRFSTLAFWCVAALTATGVYQAWRGLGSWSALTDTTYGRLLLVKIGAVVVILAAAFISRRWVALLRTNAAETETSEVPDEVLAEVPVGANSTAEQSDGGDSAHDTERAAQLARQAKARAKASERKAREAAPARGMLLRSVSLEAVFAVLVLALTTALTNSPPGRAVAEQQAVATAASRGPVDVTLPYDTTGTTRGGKGKVTIDIDPARTGQNSLHAYLYDSTGKPVDVPEIDIALTLKSKNLGPLAVKLDHLDIGHYGAADLELPMPGEWTLAVTVRSDDIDEATVTAQIAVG